MPTPVDEIDAARSEPRGYAAAYIRVANNPPKMLPPIPRGMEYIVACYVRTAEELAHLWRECPVCKARKHELVDRAVNELRRKAGKPPIDRDAQRDLERARMVLERKNAHT